MATTEEQSPTELTEAVDGELAPFDPTKKKKKKSKVLIMDIDEAEMNQVTEKIETLSVGDGLSSTFAGKKKKKKQEKKPLESESLDEGNGDDSLADTAAVQVDEEEGEGIVLEPQYPWEGVTRDYHYEELLGRVFNILRQNNPELAGEKRRTVMRPPQVLREGTKKTVFVNFMDLCKTMHRQPEHVMSYLLAEMGTSGNLDGQQRLVVKGRFPPKHFEGILRKYVNEYVMCHGCKSPDTELTKENRLFFLRCEQPILLEAGGDISDWFDPQTADVKTHIDPISKLITYFTPQGRFIHIPPGYPSSDWDCSHELPWWKDPKYMIGKLSKKTRFVRIKNVLTALEAPLEVPSEENIREILERYLPRNGHAKSYTWKAVCETKDSFINLDMDKTLDENNIPDESQLFSSLHLPPDYHIPVILVYYDDDLTVA